MKKEELKQMIINKKEELKESLKNTYCDNIVDYSDGYICDVISYISDNNIDIYTYNLLEWLKDNYEWLEQAIDELGEARDSQGHFDLIKNIQSGQYLQISQELYDNQEEMLLLFAYDYLVSNDIILNEEQQEELDDYIKGLDNNDQLEDIIEKIEELNESEVA